MARKSTSTSASSARPPEERGSDETVILTIRVDKDTSALLDALAELYNVTKTDIAREGIRKRIEELAQPDAVEAEAKEYASTLNRRYQKFSETYGTNPAGSSSRAAGGSTLTKHKPPTTH